MAKLPTSVRQRGSSSEPTLLLANLTDEQFALLNTEIRTARGFERNRARCEEIAAKIGGVERSQVLRLLSMLNFLYDNVQSWEKTGESAEELITEFLDVPDISGDLGDNFERVKDRLIELTRTNLEVDRVEKREWLETGILDHAVGFASFLDLRPNMSNDRSTLHELVPIVILEVIVEQENGDRRPIFFQLPKNGISTLRELVEDIEKKFELVESHSAISPLLAKDIDNEA